MRLFRKCDFRFALTNARCEGPHAYAYYYGRRQYINKITKRWLEVVVYLGRAGLRAWSVNSSMMNQEHEKRELFTMPLFKCPTRAHIFAGLKNWSLKKLKMNVGSVVLFDKSIQTLRDKRPEGNRNIGAANTSLPVLKPGSTRYRHYCNIWRAIGLHSNVPFSSGQREMILCRLDQRGSQQEPETRGLSSLRVRLPKFGWHYRKYCNNVNGDAVW